MRWVKSLALPAIVLLFANAAAAYSASFSYTGTLPNAESTFQLVLFVSGGSTQSVDFQTYGFGGGKNAAGQMIPPGGFDSLVAVFQGTGPSAALVNGTADNQTNFGSYMGCPPAGTVAFSNGDNVCGDINMQLMLAPGTYTVVLSDANYVPLAFSDNGTLGEGFSDLTVNGAFQTCDLNLTTGVQSCITPNGNWALDITDSTGANLSATPEPATLLLVVTGAGVGLWRRKRRT